jgi:hypothetical protein
VIPTLDDVLDEYETWSKDHGLREKRSLVTELLDEAWALEPEPADEPARALPTSTTSGSGSTSNMPGSSIELVTRRRATRASPIVR